jgi:hypothetical protein
LTFLALASDTECMKTLSLFLILIFLSPKLLAQDAEDNKMREFLTSAAYGTLVGALVGAASLAFVDNPDDELQKVAKGASLGLYAGIALGIYVTQFHSDEPEPELGKELEVSIPRVIVAPLLSRNGIDGFTSQFTVYQF